MNRFAAIFLAIVIPVLLGAEWIEISDNSEMISYTQSSSDLIEIDFHLNGYDHNSTYSKISHPQEDKHFRQNIFKLPRFTETFAIPDQGNVNLTILSSESYFLSGINLSPQESYASEPVSAGNSAIMRDLRLLPVSFHPFIYHAQSKQLEIYTDISIMIEINGSGGANCKTHSSNPSRSFAELYKADILNYEEVTLRDEFHQPSLLFITPDDDDVLEVLNELVNWKRQKGYDVTVATTAETGDTFDDIKAFIQDAYDNWEIPPEYICLAGDANGDYAIPTDMFETGYLPGDHLYGLLEGDDLLLDVHLGRISYETITSLQTIVAKIINYEKTPYMEDTEWYEKALLVGDTSNVGVSAITALQEIKEMMLDYPENWNDEDAFIEIYNDPFPSQMNTAMNSGVAYMNYQGYLGVSNWEPGTQNNSFMLPFVHLTGCVTNGYTETSDCETLLRMGTPEVPTGAIAALGQSGHLGCGSLNRWIPMAMVHAMLEDNINQMGSVLTKGKYYVWCMDPDNSFSYIDDYMQNYSLIGDPTLELWTSVPQELIAWYPDHITEGSNWLEVTVSPSVSRLEGICVTLCSAIDEEFSVTGYTDSAGEVLLPIEGIPDGDHIITITQHNHIPVIDTLSVVQEEYCVTIDEYEYIEVSGNGDGQINPGETFEIDITLRNCGTEALTWVQAYTSGNSNYITVSPYDFDFGYIGVNETCNPEENHLLEISPNAPDGLEIVIELMMDGAGDFTPLYIMDIVHGAALNVEEVLGDAIEPGVTSEISLSLCNYGEYSAENVFGTLVSMTPGLVITDDWGEFGTILPGETVTNLDDTFTITTSEHVLPSALVNFQLILENADGFEQTVYFSEAAGTANVTDPYGPDGYGYYAIDDGDFDYEQCPLYEWIEIAPEMGGEGEDLGLSAYFDDGVVTMIDLPESFNFSFYGEEYDQLTICSNGWIALGEHEAATFLNWYIPSPQGPSPMLAVFWDNLSTQSGSVSWLYDPIENYLVVEWNNAHLHPSQALETFQVILYDSQAYPTYTGDSNILMQYKEINNLEEQGQNINHLFFCTVGIENADSSTGLEYTFNNIYADANKELEDEMAILFSPYIYQTDTPYITIQNVSIYSGDDEYIEAGEHVELEFELLNSGFQNANNISIEFSIDDQFIDITEGNTNLNILPAGQSAMIPDPMAFDVSEIVPDFHELHFTVLIESDEFAWVRYIDLTAYEPNTFSLDTDSIYVEIEEDELESREIELTNTGDAPVIYYIKTTELNAPERDVSETYITCDENTFIPGETCNKTFIVYNNSVDAEWISEVMIGLPVGVTLNTATDIFGGSGGDLVWDGTAGSGVTVSWSGTTPAGFGLIHDGEMAMVNLNLTFGTEYAGDIEFQWQIIGDGYGAEPHEKSGEITFLYPLRWIILDTSYGTLLPGETDVLTANFDSADIEPGLHEALIEISCDSWDYKSIAVTLNVAGNDNQDELPESEIALLGNYPNPFNPVTTIYFSIPEDTENAEIEIYNIKGQRLRELKINCGRRETGNVRRSVVWDGSGCASGIYFYRLKSENWNSDVNKMILMK